mmetsp:Transcript_29295/g.68177  ORF Transcript_29295/g.68177 Transcript_29295/m.68177 type:complete len:1214 (-) Transcript_29295:63-3704(-)
MDEDRASRNRYQELATPEKPAHPPATANSEGVACDAPLQQEAARSSEPCGDGPSHKRRRLARSQEELALKLVGDLQGDITGRVLAERVLAVCRARQMAVSKGQTAIKVVRWLQSQLKQDDKEVLLAGHSISGQAIEEACAIVQDMVQANLLSPSKAAPKADAKDVGNLEAAKSRGRTATRSSSSSSSSDGGPAPATPKRAKRELSSSSSSSTSSSSSRGSSSRSSSAESELSEEEDVDDENEAVPSFSGISLPGPAVRVPTYRPAVPEVEWSGAPPQGTKGFNYWTVRALKKVGIAAKIPPEQPAKRSPACPPLQPHQEVPIALLQPGSPVHRLLVDHPTGSGKTREMVGVLENFFHDPRAKVPIFPKEAVCQNFYAELLRWPSRYRDFFCLLRPQMAEQASRSKDWRRWRRSRWDLKKLPERELREICREMRDVLEMKGCFFMGRMRLKWAQAFREKFPDEAIPAAPLRALRYTSAGGRHTVIQDDGLPRSALFKIGFQKRDGNVYSNKIVIMDEVHNLVRTQTVYGEQLQTLRRLLYNAQGAVLAGFTGTPILSKPEEGHQLLRVIKGAKAPACNEGYISSFPFRPRSLFPKAIPCGVPDAILTPNLRRQFVKKVTLQGESLFRYDKKRAANPSGHYLQRYCNLSVHFGSMHGGKLGSKARVLQNFATCAPKLHAIAEDVMATPLKTVVLIARSSGMGALLEWLRNSSSEDGGAALSVATMDELADFNAANNLRGEKFRVLVADVTQCGEGVSFFGVRRVILADVPPSHSGFVQAVGRAIRMYGHKGLPAEEWTLSLLLYVSVLPPWLQSTLAAWSYRLLRHHQDPSVAERKAKMLLRKLRKAGVTDLDALKQRCDAFFARGSTSKEKLKAADGARFCESLGLSRMARSLTAQDALPFGGAKANVSRPGRRAAVRRRASSKALGKKKGKRTPRQHPFVKALQRLLEAESASKLCEDLHLQVKSADEDALAELASQSKTLSAALADMRRQAIDHQLLTALDFDALGAAGTEASDGETSQASFALSSCGSSDDEEDVPAPFVMPAGWQVQKVRRGKSSVRHFVDPSGRRYTSVAQARAAVASERRSTNVSHRLSMQFQDRLMKRLSESSIGEAKLESEPSSQSSVKEQLDCKEELKKDVELVVKVEPKEEEAKEESKMQSSSDLKGEMDEAVKKEEMKDNDHIMPVKKMKALGRNVGVAEVESVAHRKRMRVQ